MSAPTASQDSCRQCGTCCRRGGPALHGEDLPLLECGRLALTDLITVRQGEPAYSPTENRVVPASSEVVKLKGKPGSWSCRFFDESKSTCTIYAQRPLECRLLKCWDPAELLAAVQVDTLSRGQLLPPDSPWLGLIAQQEQAVPAAQLAELAAALLSNEPDAVTLEQFAGLVRRDLALRERAIGDPNLTPELELFLLGRPLFTMLDALGLAMIETDNTFTLARQPR